MIMCDKDVAMPDIHRVICSYVGKLGVDGLDYDGVDAFLLA